MSAGRAMQASAETGERIVPGTPLWDAGYPDHIQRYRFALPHVPTGATVLDAGCGAGYGAAEVADRRSATVVAVDIAEEALAVARAHFDRAAITWCHDDCEKLDRAAAFAPYDVIINFENIEHLAHPDRFVSRAAGLLHESGVLLTSTPNRLLLNRLRGVPDDAPPANRYHVSEFSEAEFRQLLERHFDSVEIRYQSPAGASRLRLRLRAALARLQIMPLLRTLRRSLRRGRGNGASPGAAIRSWTIDERDTGSAWTLIAVCRRPRLAARR